MKKFIIALASAVTLGISAAVQADTTLYGFAGVSVDYNQLKAPKDAPYSDPPGNWDVVNVISYLGVEGSEELGNGLSAIYQFEFGVDIADGGGFEEEDDRPKWVGLRGGLGSLTLGTQYTPYYNLIGMNDFFNGSETFGSDIYLYPLAATRESNSVFYETPEFSGFLSSFNFQAMATANSQLDFSQSPVLDTTPKSGVDNWNVMGMYQNGPFTAGLTYAYFPNCLACFQEDDNTHLWGLGLGYQAGDFTVNFTHEQGNASTVYGKASNYLMLISYAIGDTALSAQYGYVAPDQGDHVNYYVAGAQHNLSKRTRLWVEYIGRRDDNSFDNSNLIAFGNQNVVSIGISHDF
jgi:predicted porin